MYKKQAGDSDGKRINDEETPKSLEMEQEFVCDKCDYLSSFKHSISSHVGQMHVEKKQLACRFCDYNCQETYFWSSCNYAACFINLDDLNNAENTTNNTDQVAVAIDNPNETKL